jgi:hypothetical protein
MPFLEIQENNAHQVVNISTKVSLSNSVCIRVHAIKMTSRGTKLHS